MAKIYTVLCALYLVVANHGAKPIGNTLAQGTSPYKQKTYHQDQILQIARSQLGVREATGKNDGPQVEQYLAYTGNKKGEPWCASLISWVFAQAGFREPRTAWSPALFPSQRLVRNPSPATIFGIYFPEKARVAHAGMIEVQKGEWLYTIEGNTNVQGSREGDGVYRKLRHKLTIRQYANWLPDQQKGGIK